MIFSSSNCGTSLNLNSSIKFFTAAYIVEVFHLIFIAIFAA